MTNDRRSNRSKESSFTLIETIIALGLMVVIVLEVGAVQGRAISFSEYERKVTQASWLAKSVAGMLEYKWKFYDLKDIKVSEKDAKFVEQLCPTNPNFDCNFRYNISVDNWDLPIVDMAAASLGDDSIAAVVKDQMKTIIGDEVLKVAHIEVTWPEGSRQNSVELAYLLTAQQKMDQAIEALKAIPGGPGSIGTGTGTATGTSTSTSTSQTGSSGGQIPQTGSGSSGGQTPPRTLNSNGGSTN